MTQNEMLKTEEIKHPESGRSMVEMLGTLAIMGVLSIGGIAGYQYAVTKYKSNETMDELNRRAMMYELQMENGDLLSGTILRNGEFGDRTSLGYGVEGFVSGDPTYFEIALSNVPRGVCRDLVKNYTTPVLIDVNGTEYETPSDEWEACGNEALTPEMLFVYSKDLNNTADTPNREVVSNDPFDTPCETGFYHDPNTGECVEDTVCPDPNQFTANGYEFNWDWGYILKKECVACPTADNPVSPYYHLFGVVSCEKCPDSVASGTNCGSYCLYCPAPRVACGIICCPQGEVCLRADNDGVTPKCGVPVCQKDADCTNASAPLCDTLTGQCFAGCHTNADCGSNEFCRLQDSYYTGCVKKPSRGTCEVVKKNTVGMYTYSQNSMDWWSAGNFCEALGLNMVGQVGNLIDKPYWTNSSSNSCAAVFWDNNRNRFGSWIKNSTKIAMCGSGQDDYFDVEAQQPESGNVVTYKPQVTYSSESGYESTVTTTTEMTVTTTTEMTETDPEETRQ